MIGGRDPVVAVVVDEENVFTTTLKAGHPVYVSSDCMGILRRTQSLTNSYFWLAGLVLVINSGNYTNEN